jgi:hypothetical protein
MARYSALDFFVFSFGNRCPEEWREPPHSKLGANQSEESGAVVVEGWKDWCLY